MSVKQWYDGFTFGSQRDIYNPWSITNYLKEKKLLAYWASTSSNDLINRFDSDVQARCERIHGRTFK